MSYNPAPPLTIEDVFAAIYPVGTIYTANNSTNPGTLFGGTWEEFGSGRVLVGRDGGDGDFFTAEQEGGEKIKGISAHSGTAVADHAAHTHDVTTNVTVADHASHTHTYTEVPNHVHVQRGTTTATGNFAGLVIDSSAGGNGGTISDTTTGHSTQNPTGGVATGTTNGPNAALTHSVTNNGITTGNPSATLTHSVTQPNDHAGMNVVQPYVVVYFWKRTA